MLNLGYGNCPFPTVPFPCERYYQRLLTVVIAASCSSTNVSSGDADGKNQMTQELPRGNPEAVGMSSEGLQVEVPF